MAIFKSKHKKDQNSASNRADATGGHSSSPSRRGGAGALDSSQSNQQNAHLKGSVGRANGSQQHPQAQGQGGERLYASAGSANSSTINGAPGMHLHDPNGPGYPGPMTSLRHPPANAAHLQQQNNGGGGGPFPPTPPSHQQQQQQHPSSSSSSRPEPTSSSQHTVLYPWSQRRIALLPSQHLAPLSPGDSPSLAPLSPILGPTSPLPFPRYGHSVNPVATAGSTGDLYIFGGLVQNSVRNDLYVVHANANPNPQGAATGPVVGVALVETRGEVPGPRVGHASVGVGNVLIVWGGDTKTRPEERQDDGLYLLNLSTRDWTRVKTVGRVPEGRYGHAVAMVGSRFFVFGGQTDDGGFKNDLCFFDLQKREHAA